MTYEFKLAKLMTIKENEKDRMLSQYNDSVQKFEVLGQRLYEKLKQKEEMIESHTLQMQKGLSILDIKYFQQFLGSIEKGIEQLQRDVMLARQQMNMKKVKLQEKNIECKKYEKIRAKDYQQYIKTQNEIELKQMDEVSLQQFMLHRN
ncbi:flagellar export protein FliJ [Priestia megaterium]|nr:flagellar export protein FliJ [Priestia megaterium]